jgi:hypothetical protein
MRNGRRLIPSLLLALACPAGCGPASPYGTLPGAAKPPGPEFVRLAAGTDVGSGLPEGWTDLVVKLVPELSASGIDSITAADRESLSFRTVVLAEVGRPARSGGDFTLRRVGVGLSLPINGRDTIVTMDARERLGVAASKAAKFALYASEEQLHQARVIAGTEGFALLGMRAVLRSGSSFRKVQLRYAIALDPRTGALSRAVWSIDGERVGPSMSVLVGDPVLACPTTIQVERSAGVVPKGVIFGMADLPKGRPQPIPAPLAALAGRGEYTPAEAGELEQAVRAALPSDAPVQTASSPR